MTGMKIPFPVGDRKGGGRHAFHRAACTVCGRCEAVCLGTALKRIGKRVRPEEVVAVAVEDSAFYEQSGGGVTLSGGEPLYQPAFCLEVLKQLKAAGLHTALDTCAFVPRAALEAALPHTDLFLVDFKHSDSEEHRKLTGQPNGLILENLRFLSGRNARMEIRIPLVPGCNDSDGNLERTGEILAPLSVERVRLLPYHDLARTKYNALDKNDTMPRVAAPTAAQLDRAAALLRRHGLTVTTPAS